MGQLLTKWLLITLVLIVFGSLGAVACNPAQVTEADFTEADFEEISDRFKAAWVQCHESTIGQRDGRTRIAFTIFDDRLGEAATILWGANTPVGQPLDRTLITESQWQEAYGVYVKGLLQLEAICPSG